MHQGPIHAQRIVRLLTSFVMSLSILGVFAAIGYICSRSPGGLRVLVIGQVIMIPPLVCFYGLRAIGVAWWSPKITSIGWWIYFLVY